MYRQSERNLLSSNISSTCPHNILNFGPVPAESDWRVWGSPAYFNGYSVLASLLQRWCSTEVNQTLHDVWLLHCIDIFGGSCPLMVFCQVPYLLCVQVLRFPVLAALLHGTGTVGVSQTLRHGTRNGITELSHRAPPRQGCHHVGHRR